jgi:phosphoribosylamine---glycine ligase
MRVLGIGDSCDLGAMYLELLARGHEVRVHVGDVEGKDTCAGLVPQTDDWRRELDWVGDGIIVFETAHHGELQDDLRRRGHAVVGGSALGDRLEGDRELGQSALRAAGLRTTPTQAFGDFDTACSHVRRKPGRYVLKFNGAGLSSGRTYVGERDDGADLIAMLAWHRGRWRFAEPPSFILMEHRSGVEIGVGAFFDGRAFVRPACLDWEHKRFFPGDLGEMTGEMGTLATFSGSERLFAATLARLAGPLADSGYVGWVNLNTIVNGDGVWPLELTCRFGYPGFAVLRPLQALGWDELLVHVAHARGPRFPTRDGYAVGVVLTVPPFPRSEGYDHLGKGLPITVQDETDEDRANLHWAEVARVDGALVTSGQVGYVGVVTGCGPRAEDAIAAAYRRARKVILPTVRYRNDIGQRFVAEDRRRLEELGWLASAPGTGP